MAAKRGYGCAVVACVWFTQGGGCSGHTLRQQCRGRNCSEDEQQEGTLWTKWRILLQKKKIARGVKITPWLNEKRHNLYLIAVRVYYLSWKEIPDTHGRDRRKQSDRSIWAAQQKQKKALPGSGSCCPHRSPLSLLRVDSSWGFSTYPLAISPFLNFQPLIHLSGLVVISFILVPHPCFCFLSSIMDSLETSASFQWVWWPRSQRDCIDS